MLPVALYNRAIWLFDSASPDCHTTANSPHQRPPSSVQCQMVFGIRRAVSTAALFHVERELWLPEPGRLAVDDLRHLHVQFEEPRPALLRRIDKPRGISITFFDDFDPRGDHHRRPAGGGMADIVRPSGGRCLRTGGHPDEIG